MPSWQIKALTNSLPFLVNELTAVSALETSQGNIDDAVSRLIEENQSPDRSSSVQSSSAEPQPVPYLGSRDYPEGAPNKKKQDRRMSRASKSASRTRERRQREQLYERLSSSSLEKLEQATVSSVGSNAQRRRFSRVILDDEDTEMEENITPPPLFDGSTSSESEYSITASPPKPITLKLSLKPSVSSSLDEEGAQFTQPVQKPSSKPNHVKKTFNTARDKKSLKKQAQKQAAKERRQAAAKPVKDSATLSFTSTTSSQSTVSNGLRLLHV